MSSPESSLPERWVERIFAVMRAHYGASFDRQWECPAHVKPEDHAQQMKAIWGRELSRFQQAPKAIEYALDNLPEMPPNLPQFRALCNRRPETLTALPPASGVKPPEKISELLARIPKDPAGHRNLGWAEALRRRERAGDRLSIVQRQFWREALGLAASEPA